MSTGSPQYEFTEEQNRLLGSLAGRMSFVGLFCVVVGISNILLALLVVGAIFRNQVPAEWKSKTAEYMKKLPDDVRSQAEKYSLEQLPANHYLWGVAINGAVVGLFYLLLGTWTRSAASSFQRIVDTKGNDIAHLMRALSSLYSMYSLIWTLLVLTLLAALLGLALTVYLAFMSH
jgi:hypothetical protein